MTLFNDYKCDYHIKNEYEDIKDEHKYIKADFEKTDIGKLQNEFVRRRGERVLPLRHLIIH